MLWLNWCRSLLSIKYPAGLTPQRIIALLGVPKVNQPIFVLGSTDRLRFTVTSQQDRAICLIESLRYANRLRKGTRVGVIGAGVAGVTAAISAVKCGAKVTLFERGSVPMKVFSTARHRMLHPFFYDWPREGWDQVRTEFPHMNWTFGSAVEVARRLQKEFQDFRESAPGQELLSVRLNCHNVLLAYDDVPKVTFKSDEHGPVEKGGSFDILILAVGPGSDALLEGAPSYWTSDGLDDDPRNGGITYIVGTGDSGMIDALRLRIRGYSEEMVCDFLARWDKEERDRIERDILQFETELRSEGCPDNIARFYSDLAESASKAMAWISPLLRSETKLHLIGNSERPYSSRSAPINRFLFSCYRLAEQRQNDRGYKYTPGGLKGAGQEFPMQQLFFKSEEVSIQVRDIDKVLIRTGPTSALDKLDSAIAKEMNHKSYGNSDLDAFNGRLHESLLQFTAGATSQYDRRKPRKVASNRSIVVFAVFLGLACSALLYRYAKDLFLSVAPIAHAVESEKPKVNRGSYGTTSPNSTTDGAVKTVKSERDVLLTSGSSAGDLQVGQRAVVCKPSVATYHDKECTSAAQKVREGAVGKIEEVDPELRMCRMTLDEVEIGMKKTVWISRDDLRSK